MAWLNRIFRRDRRPMTPAEFARARPERLSSLVWEEQEDGTVHIQAPLSGPRGTLLRQIAKRAQLPDYRVVELEPIGAFVWKLCDGKHTTETIAKGLQREYRMNRLESEASLNAFLQMLGQRRLLVLRLPGKPEKR